ncbi:MAG TPA: ATP-binding protein [Candidatus Lokiarchaeia archaeon]|nr:ATP-binding protein [Candidatus Lokiarchaeia archaeon]
MGDQFSLPGAANLPEENPNPVFRVTPDRTVLYANSTGRELLSLWGCEDSGPIPELWSESQAGKLAAGKTIEVEILAGDREYSFDVVPVGEMGYINLYGSDITNRHQLELALQENIEDLAQKAQMLDAANDSIMLLDMNYNFVYANEAAYTSRGYSREEFMRLKVKDFVSPAYLPTVGAKVGDLLEKQSGSYESEHVAKNGKLIPVDVRSRIFKIGDQNYILSVARDISERKLAEEALQQKAQELEESNRDLESFAHAASHDLQAPLRTISGFLTLLQRRYGPQLGERGAELVERSVAAVGRLMQLVQDLLSFSRAASRELQLQETDLGNLVAEVVADLQADVQESGALVSTGQLPALAVDQSQVRQVFHNLIHNAIKFRRDGVAPEVTVTAEGDGVEWIFSVADNGIGIDPSLVGDLFRPFKRLHAEGKYPGSGIGLSIARRVVERHGGRIWVESMPSKGSTFYFTIPG